MVSLNIDEMKSTLMSPSFYITAGVFIVGSIVSALMTDWLKNNVYDVSFKGGDAVYSIVSAAVVLAVVPPRYGRPLALGCGASAIETIASDFGVLDF